MDIELSNTQRLERILNVLTAHNSTTEDPTMQLKLIGNVLLNIGEALEGCDHHECRQIIKAAMELIKL